MPSSAGVLPELLQLVPRGPGGARGKPRPHRKDVLPTLAIDFFFLDGGFRMISGIQSGKFLPVLIKKLVVLTESRLETHALHPYPLSFLLPGERSRITMSQVQHALWEVT